MTQCLSNWNRWKCTHKLWKGTELTVQASVNMLFLSSPSAWSWSILPPSSKYGMLATEHRLNHMEFSVRVPVLSVNRYSTYWKETSEINIEFTSKHYHHQACTSEFLSWVTRHVYYLWIHNMVPFSREKWNKNTHFRITGLTLQSSHEIQIQSFYSSIKYKKYSDKENLAHISICNWNTCMQLILGIWSKNVPYFWITCIISWLVAHSAYWKLWNASIYSVNASENIIYTYLDTNWRQLI
jgi:hypothetical protein